MTEIVENKSDKQPHTGLKPLKELFEDYLIKNHIEKIEYLKNNPEHKSIEVDYKLLKKYFEQNKMEYQLEKAQRTLKIADNALNGLLGSDDEFKVRLMNMDVIELKELKQSHIGQLISANVLIRRVSEIRPRLTYAKFECKSCFRIHYVALDDFIIKEPGMCKECGGRNFRLLKSESKYTDYCHLLIEEPLESRNSNNPRGFKALIEGDLIKTYNPLNPGDVANIIGVMKVRSEIDGKKCLEYLLDINNVTPIKKTFEDIRISEKDEIEIKKLSKDPLVFERLKNSIAFSTLGYDEIKSALLLQQFGGNEGIKLEGTRKRGDIHIFLIGDPGVSKSQMLKFMSKFSPKGIYVSAKSSSGVGLTAATVKDEFTGGWAIDSGALVMAHSGLACIDELDKMKNEDITHLNEAMEQGTISLAKAGKFGSIDARCSILAAANPSNSNFDKSKKIIEQIKFDETTLSRFDLIFAIEDGINKNKDHEIANHILGLDGKDVHDPIIDNNFIKKYIAYAKRNIQPKLTKEAKDLIVDYYINIRGIYQSETDYIPITPRFLQAVERLAIARAKVELRSEVTLGDAEIAINISKFSLSTLDLKVETPKSMQVTNDSLKNKERVMLIIEEYKKKHGEHFPAIVIDEITVEIEKKCDVNSIQAYDLYDEVMSGVYD